MLADAPHPDLLDVVVGPRVMAQQGGFVHRQVNPWASPTAPRADARSRCFVSACSISPLSVHPGRRGPVRKGTVQRTAQSVAPTPAQPEPAASHRSVSYEWYRNNCGSGTLSVHFPHDGNPHRIRALFHRPAGSGRPAPGAPGAGRRRGSHLHPITASPAPPAPAPGDPMGKLFFNILATFAEPCSVSRPTVYRTLNRPHSP